MRETEPLPESLPWLKRRLRRLKRQEQAIRGAWNPGLVRRSWVWDRFFSLRGVDLGTVKYPLNVLQKMTREEFRRVVDDFFFQVYYTYYRENRLLQPALYDPSDLAEMGLPPDAGLKEIRLRFRQLVKQHHPDVGGDSRQFIKLLQAYERLRSDW